MARSMFKRRPRDNRVRDERRRKRAEEAAMQQRQRINLALKHFNDSNNEGTEYEFVRDAGCGSVRCGYAWFRHINFLAKPKGASDNEVKLFFAEIQKGIVTPPVVISGSILGPEAVEAALSAAVKSRPTWSGVYGSTQITPEVKHVFEHIVDGLFHSFGNQLIFLAVTGARGCKACDYGGKLPPEKAVVQHPVDGKFTRGLYAPTAFTQFDD